MMRLLLCDLLGWHNTGVRIWRGYAMLFCSRCYQLEIQRVPSDTPIPPALLGAEAP